MREAMKNAGAQVNAGKVVERTARSESGGKSHGVIKKRGVHCITQTSFLGTKIDHPGPKQFGIFENYPGFRKISQDLFILNFLW